MPNNDDNIHFESLNFSWTNKKNGKTYGMSQLHRFYVGN
jgi:hypothetical protein